TLSAVMKTISRIASASNPAARSGARAPGSGSGLARERRRAKSTAARAPAGSSEIGASCSSRRIASSGTPCSRSMTRVRGEPKRQGGGGVAEAARVVLRDDQRDQLDQALVEMFERDGAVVEVDDEPHEPGAGGVVVDVRRHEPEPLADEARDLRIAPRLEQ